MPVDAVCGIWRAFRWTGLCLIWVEMGACLLLCLAHLLGLLGPSICSSLFGKEQPGRGLLTGWAALLFVVGTWASFDSAC